jgi:hypothetical protein
MSAEGFPAIVKSAHFPIWRAASIETPPCVRDVVTINGRIRRPCRLPRRAGRPDRGRVRELSGQRVEGGDLAAQLFRTRAGHRVTSVPSRSREVASAAAVDSIHGSRTAVPARLLVVYDMVPDE